MAILAWQPPSEREEHRQGTGRSPSAERHRAERGWWKQAASAEGNPHLSRARFLTSVRMLRDTLDTKITRCPFQGWDFITSRAFAESEANTCSINSCLVVVPLLCPGAGLAALPAVVLPAPPGKEAVQCVEAEPCTAVPIFFHLPGAAISCHHTGRVGAAPQPGAASHPQQNAQ